MERIEAGKCPALWLDGDRRTLWRRGPNRFDPDLRAWARADVAVKGVGLEPEDAVVWLQRESGRPLRPPIAVIGPREASAAEQDLARTVGADLARLGLVLMTGGKGGVMEAACAGAAEGGGFSIGLLPDDHWEGANAHVTLPIATGLGVARNAVIARAAFALVAIGGGYGTLSEMALALQFGRPVLTLAEAPAVDGALRFETWDEARRALCRTILGLPDEIVCTR